MPMVWTQAASPVFFFGPAHAGKSELAMRALAPDSPAVVLGTAPAHEPAFQSRIKELQAQRPAPWENLDSGLDLAVAIEDVAKKYPQIMIDSLSQWLAALLVESEQSETALKKTVVGRVDELFQVLAKLSGIRLVLVSAETGAGPAPARALERLYREQVGLMNQRLARLARTAAWVSAGLPQVLKQDF